MSAEKDEVEGSAAPLLSHLIELRQRILYSLVAFAIAFTFCFFVKDYILDWLLLPYQWAIKISGTDPTQLRLQSTQVWETFVTKLKLAAFGGVILAFPYIALQVYRFIAPGLYKNERMAFLPFMIAAPVLFLVGAAFVYFLVAPMILWFSLGQQFLPNLDIKVDFVPKISEYLGFMTSLILVFGIVFQLPLVTTLLAKAGLVTADMLASKRKWAVLASFVISAMVTPGDLLTMFGLALPTILLYEFSIVLARFVKKRQDEEAQESDA